MFHLCFLEHRSFERGVKPFWIAVCSSLSMTLVDYWKNLISDKSVVGFIFRLSVVYHLATGYYLDVQPNLRGSIKRLMYGNH